MPSVRSTAAGLGLEAPHEDLVAGLQAAALDRLRRQGGAGVVQHRSDVAGPGAGVLRLGLGELGVHHGDQDALALGVVDERVEGVVAGVAHDGDAVRLRRDGFLELGDHLVRIPVGPLIGDRRPEGRLGRLGAVVDDRLEPAARRAAREEGDLHVLAELGRRAWCRSLPMAMGCPCWSTRRSPARPRSSPPAAPTERGAGPGPSRFVASRVLHPAHATSRSVARPAAPLRARLPTRRGWRAFHSERACNRMQSMVCCQLRLESEPPIEAPSECQPDDESSRSDDLGREHASSRPEATRDDGRHRA